MLIEILDNNHIHGKPYYFTSLQSRDNFILEIKEHISKINNEEEMFPFQLLQPSAFFPGCLKLPVLSVYT